ncbi:MAG TPA: adenylate/guanylate cyclase domain-containing protein [Cyclobacteriaceae bacterium]|nr:adenylate/guanylate cyclase domain-containing protein [Cyclobacteriaceae bacterium]
MNWRKNSTLLTPEFEREIVHSEYQRSKLLIGLFSLAIVIASVNFFLLDDTVKFLFGGAGNYFFVIGWLGCLVLYEAIILQLISYWRKKYQRVSKHFRYWHTVIEVSFPSFLILYMVWAQKQLGFIDSPVIFIYPLFITLSVLHLDFRTSMQTAVMAAVQYSLIVYYGFNMADVKTTFEDVIPENTFYLRSVVMIIGGMAGGFVAEEMRRRIQASFDIQRAKNEMEVLFGQQVSKEVLTTLVEERGIAKKQEATVLAMDIRNFTSFAETRTPDEIMDYQNKIFGPVIDIINQHQGVVNQIMGDGLMATFGTPVSNPLHADMAFETSLRILNKVRELVSNEIIPETRIGLGLHTGDVVTGNIGNESRKQYSISGSAVIIAFRVEQLNKQFGTELLITNAVKDKIVPGRIQLDSLGMQSMKGFGNVVEVFKAGA